MGISMEKIDHLTHTAPNLFLSLTPFDSPTFYLIPLFHLSFLHFRSCFPPYQHLPEIMPLVSSPELIINSDQYYLPGGDLYILVQNTMFRIHRYFFMHNSALFQTRLECYKNDIFDPTQTGTTCSDAIMFFNNLYTTPHTFSRFLSIIYNPKYSLYDEYTQQDWNDILLIATAWGFQEITHIALQHIDNIPNNEGQATHIPSLTNTEIEEPSDDEDMYVDEDCTSTARPLSLGRPSVFREDPTERAMRLHFQDDHGICSLGLQLLAVG